jgi:N-acetylglucosamine-6-phosphate deacetylase
LAGAGLFLQDLQIEFIADRIHNSMEFFCLLLQIKGPRFCLISDMVPPAHSETSPSSEFSINQNGRKITTKENILAGGATSVPEQVKTLFAYGIKPEEIIPLSCTNALKFFKIPHSSLQPGEDADFIVLNKSFEVQGVYEHGTQITGEEHWKTD